MTIHSALALMRAGRRIIATALLTLMLPGGVSTAWSQFDGFLNRCSQVDCTVREQGTTTAGVSAQVLTAFQAAPPLSARWLTQDADGSYYGTSLDGGALRLGTLFRITTSGDVRVLHSFSGGADGTYPSRLLAGPDGSYYGTTLNGGGQGTIFRITRSGKLSVLHTFKPDGSEGGGPYSLTLGRDGNFYGTTLFAGASGSGTVFRMTPSGSFATLHAFSYSDGDLSSGPLAEGADGQFYGTAFNGGSGYGLVFRISASGTFSVLHTFEDGTDGSSPFGGLVAGPDGNFFGTTAGNGPRGAGVFRITPDGDLTALHSFPLDGSIPSSPLLRGADGNLYGLTIVNGETERGTFFRITPSGEYTALRSFPGADGATADGATLSLGNQGEIYVLTASGGEFGAGTLSRLASSGELTVLRSFAAASGDHPSGALVQANDGNFYAATLYGNATDPYDPNGSALFRVTPQGARTVLGGEVTGRTVVLVQGADSVYGVTYSPRKVFRIAPSGTTELLYEGTEDAPAPALLTIGSDGNFYGTSPLSISGVGETLSWGTVSRLLPSGNLSVLHEFYAEEPAGFGPSTPLLAGDDGSYYGATGYGGDAGLGALYRITASGDITEVESFSTGVGGRPHGALIRGGDGNIYGVTEIGGDNNAGTVFRATPAGTLTQLYSFPNAEGRLSSDLVQGSDGSFYATTESGGEFGFGTVARITPAGEFSTVYSFGGADGAFPNGLIALADNELVATTAALGPEGGGALVRLSLSNGTGGSNNSGGTLTPAWLLGMLSLLLLRFGYGGVALRRSMQRKLSNDGYGTQRKRSPPSTGNTAPVM